MTESNKQDEEWLPIAMAPKDGTRIAIKFKSGREYEANWRTTYGGEWHVDSFEYLPWADQHEISHFKLINQALATQAQQGDVPAFDPDKHNESSYPFGVQPNPSAPARQAVRMLTEDEAKDCMEWTLLLSEVQAIQRKFCEVNGLEMNDAND